MHSLVGGSGGMFPQENFKFRLCKSASEAVGDHYNICGNWSVNSGDSSYCRFLESLPFGISLCVQGTATELSLQLGSCRFECSMYAGHEAVIHIEMCTASK